MRTNSDDEMPLDQLHSGDSDQTRIDQYAGATDE